MQKGHPTSALGLCGLGMLALLSGCGGGGDNGNGSVGAQARQFGPFQFGLSASKRVYTRGETVPLTFTVKYTGKGSVVTNAGCDVVDTLITREGQLVWQASVRNGAPCPVADFAIAEGETATFNGSGVLWNQQDLQGKPAPPGVYVVKVWLGALKGTGSGMPAYNDPKTDLAANPVTITIQ